VAGVLVLAAGCNPVQPVLYRFDVFPLFPEFWGAADYDGPPEAWVEVSVSGAGGLDVFLYAGVHRSLQTGPTDRWCADQITGELYPCFVGESRLIAFTVAPAVDDPAFVRPTVTIWPGERVSVQVRCEDPGPGGLGLPCPDSLRIELRTVDWDGDLVGELAGFRF
jgi:hypothetical protein